jgi:hypothetical protein
MSHFGKPPGIICSEMTTKESSTDGSTTRQTGSTMAIGGPTGSAVGLADSTMASYTGSTGSTMAIDVPDSTIV